MSSSDSSDSSFFSSFGFSRSGVTTSSRGGSSGTATTRGHGCELLSTFSNQLFKVLPIQLTDDLFDLVSLSINTNTAKNLFNVSSTWGVFAAKGAEEVCSNVTHFLSLPH